jgi:uncharacterized NAD(P)/FAD-binding protein YdhS
LTVRAVTIVGGGFSGASAAIQLARHAPPRLDITVIEPRPDVGRGLAYSSDDPDHRLNGTAGTHLVDPADPEEFTRWCAQERIVRADPDALARGGALFVRRSDFGRFVAQAFARQVDRRPALRLRHLRDEAIDAPLETQGVRATTRGGSRVPGDVLVIATGNAPSRFPLTLPADVAAHPSVIAEPWDLRRLRAVDAAARVLVLGTGLTALDVITTLLRRGHCGRITAVSPRALRPRAHRPAFDLPPALAAAGMLQRIDGSLAPFVRELAQPMQATTLMRALRARIAQARVQGESWYGPFDEFRDPLWRVWSALDARVKARLLRHARRWYDVHRFRAPPQNDAIVNEAERQGRVLIGPAKVSSIARAGDGTLVVELQEGRTRRVHTEAFDAIVNCTGLDGRGGATTNPMLASLTRQGRLVPDVTGIGFAVDAQCRPIGQDGTRTDRLRVIGPPTAGTFGDPLGAIFIAAQIRRMLPGIFA